MTFLRDVVALAAFLFATSVLALPTELTSREDSANLCGVQDYKILMGTPWIVYNMLYNKDQMVGTQCTGYDSTSTSSSGTQEVHWNSKTDIDYVKAT